MHFGFTMYKLQQCLDIVHTFQGTIIIGTQQCYVNESIRVSCIFCCISFACHDLQMAVTYQHHHSLERDYYSFEYKITDFSHLVYSILHYN